MADEADEAGDIMRNQRPGSEKRLPNAAFSESLDLSISSGPCVNHRLSPLLPRALRDVVLVCSKMRSEPSRMSVVEAGHEERTINDNFASPLRAQFYHEMDGGSWLITGYSSKLRGYYLAATVSLISCLNRQQEEMDTPTSSASK